MQIDKEQPQIINYQVEVSQDAGIPGPPGPYFIPSISSEGILSWSNTGKLENPPDTDLRDANSVTTVNEQTGDVVLTSADLKYTDDMTIKDALDTLLYVPIKITSLTGGNTYEVGESVRNIRLVWQLNKDPVSQFLDQNIGELSPKVRSYVINAPVTTNTVYKLTVSDGKTTASAQATVTFITKNYYGVSDKESLKNEDILKLSGYLASNRQQTQTFDCTGGKYFYFAIPESYCDDIAFKVGGLSFSDMVLTKMNVTNAGGNVTAYNVYRSGNLQTGNAISVQVL